VEGHADLYFWKKRKVLKKRGGETATVSLPMRRERKRPDDGDTLPDKEEESMKKGHPVLHSRRHPSPDQPLPKKG